MPPQNSPTQPSPPEPNDAAASLALATHLSTQLAAPQQPPEAPTGAPEDVTQIDLAPQVQALEKQVADLTKQVAQQPKDDIAEMRQMIEQALGEEDPNDGK